MNKTAIRTPEGARAIIEYNIEVLYHIPKQYPCLEMILRNTRKDLLKLLRFCKDYEPIVYKQKYCWFMANSKLTNLRGKTTKSVSSKRFNFWCAVGVIRKIEQKPWGDMTELNKQFVTQFEKKRPINTFTVYRYTDDQLQLMEERAATLLAHRVTAGNITNDKLKGCDLVELAREVFPLNNKRSFEGKCSDFNTLTELLEDLIDEKGYASKDDLCRGLNWTKSKLDGILSVQKEVWEWIYDYHAPKKVESEQYGLSSRAWIITRRT